MPDASLLDESLFRLPTPSSPLARRVLRPLLVRAAIEHALALPRLEAIYGEVPRAVDPCDFARTALDALGVTVESAARDIACIPSSGPVIVAANHPFGALEGLVLLSVVGAIRSDVRILANQWLAQIPQLRPALLGVDVFASQNAVRANARAYRAAIDHLDEQGVVILFPAGEVSRLALRDREVRDGAWSPSVVRMALRTRASVLPAWFSGRNSALFQMAGLLHSHVSTAMLPRELLKKRGKPIHLAFGTPVRVAELEGLEDDECRIDYVRLRASALGAREPTSRREPVPDRRSEALARRPDPRHVAEEVEALPEDRILARTNELEAVIARSNEIPETLREIGRQREIAFRAVGEGTGHEYDLDAFDTTYRHLVLWDRSRQRIAGAYRLGATDEILSAWGPAGLYTTTLFDWDDDALRGLGPALELGRSFVVADYQRSFSPLLTLWRGIGTYVARHPRYAKIFGPVSISSAYGSLSRQLIAQHLESAHADGELLGRVQPKNPLVTRRLDGLDGRRLRRALGSSVDVDALVSDIESSGCGLPILLREYLKLGGRVVATSVDENFNDALDALLVVDLRKTERRRLDRYLGRESAAAFLAAHAGTTDA